MTPYQNPQLSARPAGSPGQVYASRPSQDVSGHGTEKSRVQVPELPVLLRVGPFEVEVLWCCNNVLADRDRYLPPMLARRHLSE